jgi:hypothetical protein
VEGGAASTLDSDGGGVHMLLLHTHLYIHICCLYTKNDLLLPLLLWLV